jgi:glycosyltransferase involved in cell wall biosynthesis
MNKNVLMICYYYPPLTDVGSKRSVAFSKYFKKHGWNPSVLSVKNPDRAYCSIGSDQPPVGIPVERTYSVVNLYGFLGKMNGLLSRIYKPFGSEIRKNYFYIFFCIPDHFWGWIPLTVLKGLPLVRKYKVDIIYVSCSPFSAALAGAFLKLLTGKPLVLDFRDPFTILFSLLRFPKFRQKINRSIEAYLLRNADIFIVTSEETRNAYIQQYPEIKDKIFTVHNGFDADQGVPGKTNRYSKFTIIYVGEFYFYALNSRTFFEGLSLLKSKGKIDSNNFQFLFYGDGKSQIQRIAVEYGVEDIVTANSRIQHRDVMDAISRSHLQLLRIVKPMISTKLFEGIPLNTPFLATIPPGEVEEIIRKYSPSSYIINEESGEKVAEAILDAMSKYANNEVRSNHIHEFCGEFSRENLTLKLMRIIQENPRVQEPIQ